VDLALIKVRPALIFLARVLAMYAVLLASWPLAGGAYRAGLIAAGNGFFTLLERETSTRIRQETKWQGLIAGERIDLAIVVRRSHWRDAAGREQHVLAKAVSTFHQPFTAVAFLLALIFGAPWSWRRRGLQAALTLPVLHGLMLGAVLIDRRHALDLFDSPTAGLEAERLAVSALHATMTDWPAGVFIVPLLLWLASGWRFLRAQDAAGRTEKKSVS
jgi:hypothetical protein